MICNDKLLNLKTFYWEKDVFCLGTSVGQRKILSPHEESNLSPMDSMLRSSTTEPQRLYGEQSPYKVHTKHTSCILLESAMSIV